MSADQIQGAPHPPELAQWLPEEEKWWTEGALRDRGGLSADRVTGCVLAGFPDGRWSFRVFSDDERRHFFAKPGTGTIPPSGD